MAQNMCEKIELLEHVSVDPRSLIEMRAQIEQLRQRAEAAEKELVLIKDICDAVDKDLKLPPQSDSLSHRVMIHQVCVFEALQKTKIERDQLKAELRQIQQKAEKQDDMRCLKNRLLAKYCPERMMIQP